ncbi:MAG: M55 family metallopeptidase [Burkholderiaceae bacterium]|nr:M55 family metallopeptidase [Burkholderiaceae bacterium]
MKILVSIDIEGVAGVMHPEQTRGGCSEYERARAWMTDEANAAIRGALTGGATQVLVNDAHGSFHNLLLERIDERARVITGKPRTLGMMAGVEQGCDAVCMIGYHASAQTAGVLAHTINSFAFRRVRVNGREMGEAGLYGALAGEFGAPVALLSGDDVFLAETLPLFPGAIGVETKCAQGYAACASLTPTRACREIQQAAQTAMSRIPDLRPFTITGPLECELTAQTPGLADLFSQLPGLERMSVCALRFRADTMQSIVRVLNTLSAMSFMLR